MPDIIGLGVLDRGIMAHRRPIALYVGSFVSAALAATGLVFVVRRWNLLPSIGELVPKFESYLVHTVNIWGL